MADHWANAVSGNFSDAADWTGGVPGNLDVAVLDAAGGRYTVTDTQAPTVLVGLETAANATLSIAAGGLFFPGGTNPPDLINAGTIDFDDGTFLQVGQTLSNSGLISFDSSGDPTDLEVLPTGLILTGGGEVQLSDSPDNAIESNAGSIATFINEDNTIAGAGQIGDAGMTIVNGGTIKATGVNPLIVTSPNFTMTNSGALKAAGAGGLVLSDTAIDNGTSGRLKAKAGATISLQNVDVIGGTLGGAGVIQVNGSAVLDGSDLAVRNTGTIEIGDGDEVDASGGIDNAGTIDLLGSSAGANLTLLNNVTLTGGGQIVLGDSSGNTIAGEGASTLTNVDNTISGSGQVGAGQLIFANLVNGVIDGSNATNALTIDTGLNTIINNGLMEATGSGVLNIDSPISLTGTLESNGGTVNVQGPIYGPNEGEGLLEANGGTLNIEGPATNYSSQGLREIIASGTLEIGSGFFVGNLTFTGTTGVLELLGSHPSAGVVGFSTTGGTSFDFPNIGFVSAGEATFVGSTGGGTLTVTDGTNAANIGMSGDYLGSTFVASSDGHGGTIVTDPARPVAPAMTSAFAQAIAGLGAGAGSAPLASVPAQNGGRLLLSAALAHAANP